MRLLIDRATFVAGVASLVLVPGAVLAADAKRTFRCKARLDSVHDKKTVRVVEALVPDGKTVNYLDGSWDYEHMPRRPLGLLAAFSVKDGSKVHLKADFEYGNSGREAAGGNNVQVIDSKTTVDDDFDPAVPVAYPWKIAGDDYLLVVSVEPVAPK